MSKLIYNLKNEDNLYKKLKGYIIIARRGSRVTHPDNYDGGDWGVEFSDEFIESSDSEFLDNFMMKFLG